MPSTRDAVAAAPSPSPSQLPFRDLEPRRSAPIRLVPRCLLLAALAGAILTTAVFPMFDQLQRAAIWGVVVLVSCAGWGALVARWAVPQARVDVGLRLAWGMALLLAGGGVACLASVATRGVLLAALIVGVALAYRLGGGTATRPTTGWRVPAVAAFVPVAFLVTLQYYGGAVGARLSADDLVAYLVYPQKILATGTLLEPFSMRRVGSYGGQSFLQALTLIGSAHVWQVSLLDMGICLIVVLALVVADRERPRTSLSFVPVLLLLALPNIRGNSSTMMSGVVFFLALFRTATCVSLERNPGARAVLLGLLAAAAATLRHSHLVAASAFLLIFYLLGVLSRSARWRGVTTGAIAAATMIACLLPWALLSYRATGTPLYPLFPGNYRAEYGPLDAANPYMTGAAWLWINARHGDPVRGLPIFIAAALSVSWGRTRGALPALAGASLLGFLAIVLGFPLSDEWSMARYYAPFVVATVLAVSMHVSSERWTDWRHDPVRAGAPAALLMIAVAYQLQGVVPRVYREYLGLAAGIHGAAASTSAFLAQGQQYRALQDGVPPGGSLLVMLDRPFLLDFRRNPIDVIDLPGQVSPAPGMPFDDEESFIRYLDAQGFRYVAFVRSPFSENQYRRDGWTRMLGPPPSPLWGKAAPFVLKLLDRFDALATSRAHVYDDGRLVAVDLATPTSASP